jgi:Zn-dependent M28 family amino/carboxypeptidase
LCLLAAPCAAQVPVRVRCAGARASVLPVIDSTQLMADITALADDSMQGRQVGTPGGARARAYILRRLRALGLDTLPTGALEFFPPPSGTRGTAANVVAFVPGTSRPARVILVTAHYDHLGIRNDTVFNGADDNASGTAAMLAIAGWFRTHPPRHTVMFIALDGEEDGLLGAAAFVRAGLVARDSMAIDVNLDMVSRSAKRELFAVGPKRYPALLPALATTACSAGVALMLGHDKGWPGSEDWTMGSDQGAFFEAGVPFTYFGVEDHADYHQPTDDVARIDPGFFAAATRAVATFVGVLDAAP